MGDVIVIGGGCYGTFYACQLERAKHKGKASYRRVIVVDRDPGCRARAELGETPDRAFVTREWTAYFAERFDRAEPSRAGEPQDYVVPSPLMPHLMFEWVLARARQRWPGRGIAVAPVPGSLGTPYDRVAPTGRATFPSPTGSARPTASSRPSARRSAGREPGRWGTPCGSSPSGYADRASGCLVLRCSSAGTTSSASAPSR